MVFENFQEKCISNFVDAVYPCIIVFCKGCRHIATYVAKEIDNLHKYKSMPKASRLLLLRRYVRLYSMPVLSLALSLCWGIMNTIWSDRTGHLLVVNDQPVGIVSAETEIPTNDAVEIKILKQPIAYSSHRNVVLTDEEIALNVAEQEEIAFLEAFSAEYEMDVLLGKTKTVPDTAEPYALIDTTVLDNKQGTDVVFSADELKGKDPNSGTPLLTSASEDKKVKAYAVYIDDEYIGAVTDTTAIEETLLLLQLPYENTEGLMKLSFDKQVTFDKVVEMPESMLGDPESVVDKLLAVEEVTRVYEVVPGDTPPIICSKLGITEAELRELTVTMNDEPVADIYADCRVGMQIRYTDERKYIHVIAERKKDYVKYERFKTILLDDETLYEGTQRVEVEGVYGEYVETYVEQIDDGVKISAQLIDRVETKSPITEIIRRGTKKTITEVNTDVNAGGKGKYFWPVGTNEGKITCDVGGYEGHKGIDIAAPYGTPIYAAAGGIIKTADRSGWSNGYGKYISIENNDGNLCYYAHMSYLAEGIEPGVEVVEGQLIGYVGSTGDSTGNHLHFEVRSNGIFLNPNKFVSK